MKPNQLSTWEKIVKTIKNPENTVRIGIVGKYVDLKESYKSLNEALIHGGIANNSKIELVYIDSENLTEKTVTESLTKCARRFSARGILDTAGLKEKFLAIQFARENRIPLFWNLFWYAACVVIEFARHVAGIVPLCH